MPNRLKSWLRNRLRFRPNSIFSVYSANNNWHFNFSADSPVLREKMSDSDIFFSFFLDRKKILNFKNLFRTFWCFQVSIIAGHINHTWIFKEGLTLPRIHFFPGPKKFFVNDPVDSRFLYKNNGINEKFIKTKQKCLIWKKKTFSKGRSRCLRHGNFNSSR